MSILIRGMEMPKSCHVCVDVADMVAFVITVLITTKAAHAFWR